MKSDHLDQNPAKSPGNVASGPQDTWDRDTSAFDTIMTGLAQVREHQESLLLMTDKERGQLNAKLCRIADPECEACQ